jgi:hypothetical protein
MRTIKMTRSVPFPAYVAKMMTSGNVGMIKKIFVNISRISSAMPPR